MTYEANHRHDNTKMMLIITVVMIALLWMCSCKGLEPKTVRYYEKRGFRVYKPVSDKDARHKTLKSKKQSNCSWTW